MKARQVTKFGEIQVGKIPVVSFLPPDYSTWIDLPNLFLAARVGISGAKGTFLFIFNGKVLHVPKHGSCC